MIPVFKPSVSNREIESVKSVLESGWWGAGPKAAEFEEKFARFIGTKNAVALNSCTAGLHLAVKVCDFPKGSEIITTPVTFISTAYAALYNDCRVVFADVEEDTLNINPDDIRRKITSRTKAIIPVHYGGHACRMDEIMQIAKEHKLAVIEDCAHATGGKYKNKMLGSIGDFGCFSFQAVKNLATGDGGMVVMNDGENASRVRKLRWLGISRETGDRTGKDQYKWNYTIDEVGWKFQMPDILAAIGIVQLERISELNGKREKIWKRYNAEFENLGWLETPVVKDYAKSGYHNYVIKTGERDKLMQHLMKNGISSGVHYLPAYKHPVFRGIKADCPVAERAWKKLLTLPLYPDMTDEEVGKVVEGVKGFKPEIA
ncbi:DegT/DnrJ/EryC1/StrS family aminotransferase [Candidatus Woesearchaeota archaeon]|nr:DegT/DnrJ/EryC1/StrS family aminotransferase [Candidatus Woesearchaeota archaeon]